MGVLAALGITLAVGLADGRRIACRALGGSADVPRPRARAQRSRGRALALGVGLCLLVALRARGTRVAAALDARRRPGRRRRGVGQVAVRVDAGGLALLGLAVGAALAACSRPAAGAAGDAACPGPARERQLRVVVAVIAVAQPIATTSSFRSAYWDGGARRGSRTSGARERRRQFPPDLERAGPEGRVRARRAQPLRRDAVGARPGRPRARARDRRGPRLRRRSEVAASRSSPSRAPPSPSSPCTPGWTGTGRCPS